MAIIIPSWSLAQIRSLTSVGILAGYDHYRIPDYRLAGTELKHGSSPHQISLSVTAFKSFRNWIGGATFTYIPGAWTFLDSVNLDESGHSIKLETGYLVSRSENFRVFPMLGLGKWTYCDRLRANDTEMNVITSHKFSTLIMDLSINAYFVATPHEHVNERHPTTLVGFKIGINGGVPMKRMTSSNFDPWKPGIQSIYFQVMISGFAWRSEK
jgi:hypothetical protein